MINSIFGNLTVIAFSHRDKNYHKHFMCRCTCGKEKIISLNSLKSGSTISCGCYLKKRQIESSRSKIGISVGDVFNRLKVIELDSVKDQRTYWKCQCLCGTIITVMGKYLKNKHVQSCGIS